MKKRNWSGIEVFVC